MSEISKAPSGRWLIRVELEVPVLASDVEEGPGDEEGDFAGRAAMRVKEHLETLRVSLNDGERTAHYTLLKHPRAEPGRLAIR